MKLNLFAAALLAAALPLQSSLAQAGMTPTDPGDTPEEIASDAARDLKDTRFYNKPGATRAQYNADWQTCRLIARGSRTPGGTIPYVYTPGVSPAAGIAGGVIGGLIAGAIAEGEQRRANRRSCLMIKGWRQVDLPAEESARVREMTDDQRSAWFDSIVGAATVPGKVTEHPSFSEGHDFGRTLDRPVSGPSTVFVGRKVDPSLPIVLAPGEAALVLVFRRPDENSAGRSASFSLTRYDMKARDLMFAPKDAKKTGDRTTYGVGFASDDRKASYEVQVVRVTPGDYVVTGTTAGPAVAAMATSCFGTPTFRVEEGETLYLGDFTPFWGVPFPPGEWKLYALSRTDHLEEARAALIAKQPALGAAMKSAAWFNGATHSCSGMFMGRGDFPGMPSLPDPAPQPDPAMTTAAVEHG